MKKNYLLGLMSLTFVTLQAQNFDWARKGGLWAYDHGFGIVNDNAGNVYVAGKYEDQANFSGVILPIQGNHDIFLAKYTPNGDLTWITTAGGILGDYATCIAYDGANSIYIGGEIEGNGDVATFQNSSVTLTAVGSNDIMLAKYDLDGNIQWARSAGGIAHEKIIGITADNSGNVYVCGAFREVLPFNGSTSITSQGHNDIFVAKYDANGNFQWVRNAGSTGRDEGKSIKCDAAGNVYVCGMFEGTVDFWGQSYSAPNGYFDMFLAKFDASGNVIWVNNAGGDYDDVGWGVTIDNAGMVYVAGEFNAYAHFGAIAIPTSGSADIFVACYNSAGNISWVKSAGGDLVDKARGIATDGTHLYITGQFGATANFGGISLSAADSSDVFMARLDNSGTFNWATSVGGTADVYEELSYESGDAISADGFGNVYVTGGILNGGIFGGTSVSAFDRTDVFVTRISQQADVGISNTESEGAVFSVFPNPANGIVTISLYEKSEQAQLSVLDVSGRTVQCRTMKTPASATCDLSLFAKGIYFIEVKAGDKSSRKKIILE
jgi:hypothetical protein